MKIVDSKVIHRFIRDISEYEYGGEYYAQIIPVDSQAYAMYDSKEKSGLYYVLGDGEHTYIEIRDGKGSAPSAKEYPVYDGQGGGEIDLKDYRKAKDQDVIDDSIKDNISDVATDLNLHVNDKNNPHEVTKAQIGLDKVDNTSDLDKPVSYAVHLELDKKADKEKVISKFKTIDERLDNIITNNMEEGTVTLNDGTETAVVYTVVHTKELVEKTVKDAVNEAIDIKSDEPIVHLKSNNDETDVYTKRKVDELLSTKQEKLSDTQVSAINSGITSDKVTKYDQYDERIKGKADKATTLAGYTITDAYTKDEVNRIIDERGYLPDQEGHSGEFLTTNGESTSWKSIDIPTKLSDLENDVEFVKDSELKNVAKTGSYNDLTDKPEIPSIEGLATEEYVNNHHDDTKQDVIEDLDEIREGASLGKTALQSFTEEDPTVPSHVKEITAEDIVKWNNKSDFSGSYNDLSDKPEIPSEETVANWGFTKNEGTITSVKMNGETISTSGEVDLGTVITEHQDISGKADKEYVDEELAKKQDIISDLQTIREGAALGATALQSVPEEYALKTDIPTKVSELENDSNFAEKATTLAGYGIEDAYTKSEVDSLVSSTFRYKGTVDNYEDLPTSDQKVGDVYNIKNADAEHGIKAGDNVAWSGTEWDVLSGLVDLSNYYTKSETEALIPDVSEFITKDVEDLTNYTKSSDLSTVATTGSYNDLLDKPEEYELPVASSDTLGGVKVGEGLTIDEDGVLKATGTIAGVSSVNDMTGEVELDSSNLMHGDRTIADILDELLYVEPKITSFTGGGTYEVGSNVSSTLKWTVNKKITSQSLNQGIGALDTSITQYEVDNITTNKTYTITVSDGKKSVTANTSFTFLNNRFWGVSEKETLTSQEIFNLTKELSNTRTQSRTFNCSGGKYFYFVIPTSLCSGISFKVGGLAFSDMLESTIDLTNSYGNTTNYTVYRVNSIQQGDAIAVQVL